MARAHAVAAVIEDAAGQQGRGVHPCGPMICRLLTQLGLDGVEQVPIENAWLFAMEGLTLEWHLTDIEAIAKEVGERPAGEWNAADEADRVRMIFRGYLKLGSLNLLMADLRTFARWCRSRAGPCRRPRAPCAWTLKSCPGCARK